MQRQSGKIATVFGGTGFLGRLIVKELAACGLLVRVATRVPESAYELKILGDVGQIIPVACDYADIYSVAEAVRGADFVVNCIGILYEKGKRRTFQRVHVDLSAMISKVSSEEGVSRLVHISSLGCNSGISRYARSKLEGEQVALSNYPKATVLRPGVMFGWDDQFFNLFAELARYVPFMPLIGGGKTRLQPVYVGDVAMCVIKALNPATDKYQSRTYQLGGPGIMTLKEVYELISKHTGREKKLVTIPYKLAKYMAWFLEFWPSPVLTRDQVNALKTDNVAQENALGLSSFGIVPKSVNLIVPEYLERYREGGSVSKYKAAAQN